MNAITLPADCLIDCYRCAAEGRLDCYAHVHGGVCFLCWGTKRRPNAKGRKVLEIAELEKKLAKLRGYRRHALTRAAIAALEEDIAEKKAALAA